MKKNTAEPGKVIIVHHPPQPDAPTPKSQPSGEDSKGNAEPETETPKEKTAQLTK